MLPIARSAPASIAWPRRAVSRYCSVLNHGTRNFSNRLQCKGQQRAVQRPILEAAHGKAQQGKASAITVTAIADEPAYDLVPGAGCPKAHE